MLAYGCWRLLAPFAPAIFFAMFFDGFDGRVARLTRTQSQFGVELDSLAGLSDTNPFPASLDFGSCSSAT